jgi:hypothetical protein
VSVSTSPGAGSPAAPAAPRGPARAVAAAGYTVLPLLGLAVGVVGGPAAHWLSWLWLTGTPGRLLAGTGLAVGLVLLFAGCRAAGWGMGSRLGAGLFAVGWTAAALALVGFTSGGDILLTNGGLDSAVLFGGVFAVALATVLTPR